MATEPGPYQDTGNPKDIRAQDFGSLVLRVEKVGVTTRSIKPDPFAVYQVSLRINVADPPSLNGLHWDIWRRFSEFAELHAEFGKPKLQVKFPPKTLWRKLSNEFLEERRQLLDQYLQALAGEPDRRNNDSFREFVYPRKPVAGDQPALAGDRTTEDTDAAPANKSGDETLKPGSSGTQGHTPMSSAAAAVSVSDNAEPGLISPSPFDPDTPSSTKKEPPDPTCTNLTLPSYSRLVFPRAPVIHASVCSSMRNSWSVGTPIDVYSNSTKSWRPGRVFAIGKTSGYPRSAQEDALTIAYGDNSRSRKILPRSSTELRAARQNSIDDEMEEKVNPAPESIDDAWTKTVQAAREVLSQANALEDQSHSPPHSEAPINGVIDSNTTGKKDVENGGSSNPQSSHAREDTEKTLTLEDTPKHALPKVASIPENMAVVTETPQPQKDTKHPLLTSKDTATERRTSKPTPAPAPTEKAPTPTEEAPAKEAPAPIKSLPAAKVQEPSRRQSKPRWMRWITEKLDKSNTANKNKSSKKSPPSLTVRTQRKNSLERKSEERATPSETFTVTNQLESLPNTPRAAKSSKENATDGKIQVLDKLRVEIPGRKQRKAKAKAKRKKKQRPKLDPHSDTDEPLPDRLPPDHTVNVLDPNTQRRLSRIRHHLVIKARRHSPA